MYSIIVSLVLSVQIFAADNAKEWPPSFLKCGEEANVSELPKNISRTDLLNLLRPEAMKKTPTEVELVCAVGVQEWTQAGTKIAFLETKRFVKNDFGGAENAEGSLRLAIAQITTDGKLKLASELKTLAFADSDESFSSLDMADYKISPHQFAFGVRSQKHYMYGGGGGLNEWLSLYTFDTKEIKSILNRTLMESSSLTAGNWHKDGTREHFDNDGGSAVIKISEKMTDGHFDIIKRRKKSKKQMIYKWNGIEYKSSDKDPIKDQNED